jgi:hypothetical protein
MDPANPKLQVHAAPSPAPIAEVNLGLPTLNLKHSRWSSLPMVAKIGVAAALVAALFGLAYVARAASPVAAGDSPAIVQSRGGSSQPVYRQSVFRQPSNDLWIENWAGTGTGAPRIMLWRHSAAWSDYRVEFQAHIENQAIGWVYRALDARNYYLAKLEATQPGPEPPVVLARYAVIDGQLETRVETPLPMPLRRDALYKVRFEAVGGRFTTWVQDQKIAAWTDRRISAGGVGWYAAPGEGDTLPARLDVVPLTAKQ